MTRAPTVVGFAEYVDFPEWGIERVRGKIDTGARTSALHVSNIRELAGGRVGFDVRLHRRNPTRIVHVETRIARRGRVRPSNGDSQTRLFVAATLRIGPIAREVEVSLVDRDKMIYRMLVGRNALGPEVLVDPARRYLVTSRRAAAPAPGRAKGARRTG
jgi:hypothetical protein